MSQRRFTARAGADHTSRPSGSLVQALEPRRLLATVSVVNYGAVANDAGDDSAAFQNAIDAAGTGGTVIVPTGTFRIAQQLNPRSDRTIIGGTLFDAVNWNAKPLQFVATANSTLQATGNFHIFKISGSNLTFKGLTFDGRGIWMERSGASIDNVVVDNNWFKLPSSSSDHRSSIQFQTLIRNTRITNNVFDPIAGEVGIYGYYWDNLLIANNAFMNGVEGIHVINHDDKARDMVIEQNYFAGLHRMGIEYQAGGWNTVVQDNWYENPVMTSNFNDNRDTFAYSIICDRSQNTIVRRNVSIAPERPDGTGVRVIFELGGFNLQAYDNYSDGGNHVVAVNGTGATGVVRDNLFKNYLKGPSNANGAKVTFANNGPNVPLTWSLSRGRPGPNHRLGAPLPDPDPDPEPDPDPGPDPPPPPPDDGIPDTPVSLSGSVLGLEQVVLNWHDMASTEDGYVVERLADDGVTWLTLATLGANANTFSITGLASGKSYSFRVRAFNTFGYSAASNVATLKMPLPDIESGQVPTLSPLNRPRPSYFSRGKDGGSVLPPIIPFE